MGKKLTDSEIVSLLKCCSKSNCYNCGYNKQCDGYTSANYALDLINRLQAENEEKEDVIQYADKEIKRLNAENERLKSPFIKMYEQFEGKIKAEAYKDCIEKVKMEAENATCVYEPDRPQADNMKYHISNKRLDNLLKELVSKNE